MKVVRVMNNSTTTKTSNKFRRSLIFPGVVLLFVLLLTVWVAGCSVNEEAKQVGNGTKTIQGVNITENSRDGEVSGDSGDVDVSKTLQGDDAAKVKEGFDMVRIRMEVENKMGEAMCIPESDNGWVDYQEASLQLKYSDDDNTNPHTLERTGINGENAKDFKKLIEKNESVLAMADRGFSKKSFQVYMDYQKGLEARLPNLLKIRTLGYLLTAAGDYESSQGNYKQAAKRYLECIRLGQGMGNNGNLIFGMIGIAVEKVGLKHLKAMLNNKYPDQETLNYIAVEMKKMDKEHFTMKELLDGEMIYIEYTFDTIINGTAKDYELQEYLNNPELVKSEKKIYEDWYLEAVKAVEGDDREESIKDIKKIVIPDGKTLAGKVIPNIRKAYLRYSEVKAEFNEIVKLAEKKYSDYN